MPITDQARVSKEMELLRQGPARFVERAKCTRA
jgi:hypothetical protein